MLLKDGPDWYKNDTFWLKYKPLMFDPDRMEDTEKEVDFILKSARPEPGGSILDLCCGEGRHDLVFARKGFKVTGVDITRSYLEKGISDAVKAGIPVEFIQGDILDFRRPGSYEMVLNWFTSFGYFDDPEDDYRVVQNAFDSLKPGGKLVIETLGKESVCLNFREREWFQRDGYLIMLEYKLLESCTRLENRWIFHPDNPEKEDELTEAIFSVRLYSAEEMGLLLGRAGFNRFAFYGGIDNRPYDHKATTMITIATKG